MERSMFSVGIDVGTSTTQLIFGRLLLEEEESWGRASKLRMKKKDIIYRSRIYETPLKESGDIDEGAVRGLVASEYRNAGFVPKQIRMGAVIITGESSRKRNARAVAQALADFAGDFVTAEAGPDLEAVLAGKGAGADRISRESGKITANVDIGGGTANICVFRDGEVVDTACYDIGGRILRVRDGHISSLSRSARILGRELGWELRTGEAFSKEQGRRMCRRMAELLAEAAGVRAETPLLKKLETNHPLSLAEKPQILTFSGGVADCMGSRTAFRYGDLGDLLGQAVAGQTELSQLRCPAYHETIRATVIGAGNFSVEISGSTVDWRGRKLPLKNIPVLWIKCGNESEISEIYHRIQEKRSWLSEPDRPFAAAMAGIHNISFSGLEQTADQLAAAAAENQIPAVILEADMGKALGQALKRRLGIDRAPICVDEIRCRDGDYIDIGEAPGRGDCLLIAVKTLIF